MRVVSEAICRDLDAASEREWLETNGLGGFASSTITGLNTRRYHGLLVAATKPPVGRSVLLSKFEETIVIDGKRTDLSANRYPGVIHPQGYLHLKQFRQDPFPVFVYQIDGVEIEKSVFMVQGENTTVIQYRVSGAAGRSSTLELRPLIAFRDYHSTAHENGALNPSIDISDGLVSCEPYQGMPKLFLAHTQGTVERTGDWYRNFEYAIEQRRGLDYHEDLFNPFVLRLALRDEPAVVIASTEPHNAATVSELRASETARHSDSTGDPILRTLREAASQFIVRRGDQSTVIAGYHWFSDWGRDTMIALPGLTLATGQFEAAKGILLAFARSVDRGMLPNRFPDAGESPEYNTVDATLWFFEAVRAYAAYTGNYEFVRTMLYGVLSDIIGWHERGTRYGIRMDEDGLLLAGEPGVQLTWMDAKIGDWVVTPRHGKPVEIQALWHNGLRVMEDLAARFGDDAAAAHYREIANRASLNFERLFWNEESGYLYDCISGGNRDGSIRPNQIFAVSLFHTLLPPDKAARVVEVVEHHLLTPYGLRSLSPSHPDYRGRYEGDSWSRDSAYHQGTVWPWLLGPFVTAYVKVQGRSPEALLQAAALLQPLSQYLIEVGLGQIPEVFDGDAPQRPGGCMAQAWSVAEILRVLVEDIGSGIPAARTASAA